MRQIWIPRPGPPEVLELREAPDPVPAPGQVQVRVEASGVNFADVMGRLGLYPDLPPTPVVPGYEVAGRVVHVGQGVGEDWVGREVLALTRFGGYADQVCVPWGQVFERPATMGVAEGAAFPVNFLTAYQLLVVMGRLASGETVLLHSAGGGVGTAAVQLARTIGATVVGVASPHKHDAMRKLGVAHCVDRHAPDLERAVLACTGGRRVDLALDATGGRSFMTSYRLLRPTGRLGMFGLSASAPGKRRQLMALVGALAGVPWLRLNPVRLMNDNKGTFGVNLGRLWGQPEMVREWMDTLIGSYRAGSLRPVIARRFAAEDVREAHHYLQDARNIGKVILSW